MISTGEKYTVNIESMNNFANGVCHIDGMAVFVAGGVDGDECEIEITKVLTRYAYANIIKIIKPSVFRIESKCPCFSECGGCIFLHTNTEHENQVKLEYVKSIFKKNSIYAEFDEIVAPVSEKYRNKVVLFYDSGAFGYKIRSSDRIIPHKKCLLNEEIFDAVASFTAERLRVQPRALYMRKTSGANCEIMVCLIFKNKDFDKSDIYNYANELQIFFSEVKTVLYAINSDKSFALENCTFKKVIGDGYINEEICGMNFRISAKSFYQINHECAEQVYEKVVNLSNLKSNEKCADLFCGTGVIGLIMAKRTNAVVTGVEIEPDAIEDAKKNAELNGIKNVEFYAGNAENFQKNVSLCIVDPPRKGCSALMTDTLLRLSPKRILYVSCNPETLIRDLKILLKKYKICAPVSVFNMFPRTGHVEIIVLLSK